MRATVYLARQLGLDLFLTWALLQASLLLLLGAFLLLRWPLLARLPTGEALGFLFVEIGPTSLALALPLGLALYLQKVRQSGELQAIAMLPLGPVRARLGWLLALLPFCLLFFFWAGALAPLNRARLEAKIENPLLLLAGGRYEELDRAASELDGLAISYDRVEGNKLEEVTLLRRQAEAWTALSAESLELLPPGRIQLQQGRIWHSKASPWGELGFQRLALDLLAAPRRSSWNPDRMVRRAWWSGCALLLGLALVMISLGRQWEPGLVSRVAAWMLPPILFGLGALT